MTSESQSARESASSASAAPSASSSSRQFTSFRIGAEEYAIDIMAVREIKGWTETTVLPNQPKFVLGVLNLRGTIVPIFDLRCRFGLGLTTATRTHVIIIANVNDRTIGLLVDAVSDILTATPDQIRPVPEIDRGESAEFMSGIINVNESMVVILSLEKLFGRNAIAATEAKAA